MYENRTDKWRHTCLICFLLTDLSMLKTHHHCCERGTGCVAKYTEIVQWEHKTFGKSLLEELSKCY